MFIALLSTIMSSFADVFWKKSLKYNVRERAHSIASYPLGIILMFYFIFTGFDIFSVSLIAILIVSIISLIDVVKEPINQYIYKEEKISVIMPYQNLNKVFIIIASFFLFQDVSNITFCITIITVIIIILASIDIKTRKVPKNFGKILFIEVSRTISALLGGWLVLSYSEIMYFNIYVVTSFIPILFLCHRSGQLGDLKKKSITFWWYRIIAALGWVSWFLSLVVIKNLGLSVGILLGFFGLGVTLFVSYVFLKDVPSRKNIILTFTVAILIGIGYYFK